MAADKIRIKKYQKPKVQEWCDALNLSESRFVEDAIGFYVRFLEGKHPIVPTISGTASTSLNGHQELPEVKPVVIETDDPDEFDGELTSKVEKHWIDAGLTSADTPYKY